IVGGKVVYGAGDFKSLDEAVPPPAMPDWSPVRSFGGYAAWGASDQQATTASRMAFSACNCASQCSVHGHDHARAWTSR
ncbi:hypothetical protein RMT89_45550, partial [Streptomyces sp. P17]|nr:hypothetical protein [Streptomyces sp. P17]